MSLADSACTGGVDRAYIKSISTDNIPSELHTFHARSVVIVTSQMR